MTQATVFVVDDDDSVRDSLSMLLDSVDLAHACYASGDEFLQACTEQALQGCLVLDIRMPGMSGLELQAKLLELGINIPIIFITGHGDIPMAVEAMRLGALDFIRKPFRDQELLDRINEALTLDSRQRDTQRELAAAQAKIDTLTPRERQIFERVCDGQANKVIAIDLGISERTVEIHRGQVMQKTQARSLAALVRLKFSIEQAGS